jgi:hypothetical protein
MTGRPLSTYFLDFLSMTEKNEEKVLTDGSGCGNITLALNSTAPTESDARVVELVDSLASGASARKGVRVRLPPRAPRRSKRCIVCSDFFYKKSERTHFIAPPFQITTAALGCDLVSPLCGVFLILQKYRL